MTNVRNLKNGKKGKRKWQWNLKSWWVARWLCKNSGKGKVWEWGEVESLDDYGTYLTMGDDLPSKNPKKILRMKFWKRNWNGLQGRNGVNPSLVPFPVRLK